MTDEMLRAHDHAMPRDNGIIIYLHFYENLFNNFDNCYEEN